jgi:long-chain fatty acid transport protein
VALAGSGVSFELGPESTLTNPALLATLEHKELTLGLRDTRFALELDGDGTTRPFPADLANGLFAGVVSPLEVPLLRAGVGLFAVTPPDYLVRAHRPLPEVAQFPVLVGRAEALDLGVALGVGYGPVSFGAGVRILAALSGEVGVEAGQTVATAGIANELRPAWAPEFGLGADLGKGYALGLAFRTTLRADFDVTVKPTNLGGLSIPPLNVEGVAHYEPLRVDLEASRRFGAARAVLGLRYERWSDFPGWLAPTVECPPGDPGCGASEPEAPGYSDVFTPRIAGSYRFPLRPLEIELRVGYTYVPTPVPEQTGTSNVFDNARHGVAAGYSIELPRELVPLRFDAAFRLDLLVPRTHTKSEPLPGFPASTTTSGTVTTFQLGAGVEL